MFGKACRVLINGAANKTAHNYSIHCVFVLGQLCDPEAKETAICAARFTKRRREEHRRLLLYSHSRVTKHYYCLSMEIWSESSGKRISMYIIVDLWSMFDFRSTDSQLKLWDISKQQCLRTFKGHMNEKNFVGLATNGDYVACGMSLLFILL